MVTLATWTMTKQYSHTIRAALEEAADAKRDQIDACRVDHSQGCEACRLRAAAAAEYDRLTEIITEAYARAPRADPGLSGPGPDGRPASSRPLRFCLGRRCGRCWRQAVRRRCRCGSQYPSPSASR